MSRRERIRMDEAEVAAFLEQERTMTCATNGPRGLPHLMPLWYVVRDGELWAWTYAASQKAANLRRDPRATLQVEDGESYELLRGVALECDVVLHEDFESVRDLGLEIFARYGAPPGQPPLELGALHPGVGEMVARQAGKRVGMQFLERRRTSWDHRKLGGVY